MFACNLLLFFDSLFYVYVDDFIKISLLEGRFIHNGVYLRDQTFCDNYREK